jgi:hypothetical protein
MEGKPIFNISVYSSKGKTTASSMMEVILCNQLVTRCLSNLIIMVSHCHIGCSGLVSDSGRLGAQQCQNYVATPHMWTPHITSIPATVATLFMSLLCRDKDGLVEFEWDPQNR